MEKTKYPKVKVREQDDREDLKGISLLPMNGGSCFPVKDHEDISPPYVAKIPASYVPSVLMSTTSVSEGLIMPTISVSEEAEKNDNFFEEDDKINIRVSSILRPRAVLSSPDNDAVIGNKNRMKVKQPSALKNHNLVQSRHVRCKVISSKITESPINTRYSKDADDSKSDIRGNKGLATAAPSQKSYLRTKKSSSVRTLV
ncbi:uncharacterized protein LOC133858543 [Alnus glutinosa]|uniref:uncharacterized protein LOC133858543 n=1 Tax=Alnus glutinosa TaxID=3517 RepID=UPI002D78096C|nr:uncharacterized protein LOC133858543 [Alnus glutinosa]